MRPRLVLLVLLLELLELLLLLLQVLLTRCRGETAALGGNNYKSLFR